MKRTGLKSERWLNFAKYLILIVAAIIMIYPVWSAFNLSMMTDAEATSFPPRQFPSGLHLTNIQRALRTAPLGRYLINSIIQSLLVMSGQLITACLAAYAFAFIDFRWRNIFFIIFLSTMMIPWEATIIPNYLLIKQLRWTDTFLGLSVPFMATGFGTFLLRQFFLKIPRDLKDAAVMDGCGHFRFLTTILLPLARPAVGTLAIYSFLQTYNQYLWPLLITNKPDMRTVQIGIALLQDEERYMINNIMAGVVFILVPTLVLFIITNKQLIRGLTAGAVKG